jgi:hypothetical protein
LLKVSNLGKSSAFGFENTRRLKDFIQGSLYWHNNLRTLIAEIENKKTWTRKPRNKPVRIASFNLFLLGERNLENTKLKSRKKTKRSFVSKFGQRNPN